MKKNVADTEKTVQNPMDTDAQHNTRTAAHDKPARGSRWFILMALVAGMAFGVAGAALWFNAQNDRQYDSELQKAQLALDQSRLQLEEVRAQLDTMQGQLVVEESTRNGLEASLLASQTELGLAQDKLAFFNQLLPPGPAGSISIRALDIERQGPILQYRVLLMRNGSDDAPFKGEMQFVAKGSQLGKAVKITLQAAQAPGAADQSADTASANGFELSFDQFQRGGGFLTLPQGFTPQTVTLNVLEGSTVRVSRTVTLSAAD
jgi:hypothetical protein